MSPQDLRDWITRLGISHREGAEALGLKLHAFRKLLYGQNAISKTVALLAGKVEGARGKRRKT